MFKTKHILEGIGPDGKGFCVSKDARGFIIKCGHQKQTAIRLPAEFSEAEINISSISERIHSHLLFKENKRKNEESEKKSQGKESRRKTSETVVIKEGQTITGDIGPKRLRQSNEIFTFCADEVGARSAINRDYGAERRKCEENKRIRVEAQARLSFLLEERDDFISKVGEYEVTFRGLLSIFFNHIGGVSTSDALPLVEMIRGAYPETEKVLEEMEDFEIEAARVNAEGSMSGTMSISAFRRGLKMSKKEYSKLRVLELKLKSTNHIELERRVEHLQTNCKKLDDDLHSRNLIVRSLKQIILKLKRKVPGGLSSWIQRRVVPSSDYPQSTRSRHLRELEELLLERTDYNKDRQMTLVKGLFEKYGHKSHASAAESARADDETAVHAAVFEALRDSVAIVKCNGRPTNHLLGVRQVLFTVASARLTPHLRSVAGDLLRVDPSVLRFYQNSLDDLICGKKDIWFASRAKIRSTGRFSQTPSEILFSASLHWDVTSVPSANKKDICRNPKNPTESKLILYNYEPLEAKHSQFLEIQRAKQLQDWETEAPSILAQASKGSVAVISTYSRQKPFYVLIELLSNEVIKVTDLDSALSRVVSDENAELWITGRLVVVPSVVPEVGPSGSSIHVRTEEIAVAPLRALRYLFLAGDETGASKIGRRNHGIFEQKCQRFNMALGIFRACKPFYVKKGTRETCLCVYHLRWDLMIEGLRRYFQKHLRLRSKLVGAQSEHDVVEEEEENDEDISDERAQALLALLLRPGDLRSKLMCEQPNGKLKPECLEGSCHNCSKHKKVKEVFDGSGLLPLGALKNRVAAEDDGDVSEDENLDSGLNIDEEDEAEEERRDIDELDFDDDLIEYDKWEGRLARLADGTEKKKYDFFTVQVSLRDFWEDFSNFFAPFVLHHDLNKDCKEAWYLLPQNFRRGEAVGVIDAAEAHKHERRRQHQSAYFQQLSSHIWVVVIYLHVEDLGNISEEERQKLLHFFEGKRKRAVVRETHFFITQDAEIKDQSGVQHVLRSIMDYLKGRGKWARQNECASCGAMLPLVFGAADETAAPTRNTCPTCGGIANFFDQNDLDKFEEQDRQYYQGNGAPAPSTTIQWFKAFSDGSAQQFMNSFFFLFLSMFSTLFGICVVWNWFCSCHGKCVCDPEGGSLKAAADAFEAQDSPLGDRRMVIRNARDFVEFGRAHLAKPSSNDFFSKDGNGVYRRFFHFVPVNGRGAVNRRLVRKAESAIHLKGTMERVKIRSIRRVAGTGFPGLLWASKRPCCDYACPCMGGGTEGRHDFAQCRTSDYTKCVEIQLTPLSSVSPTPTTRGALALTAVRLGAEAAIGEILATETESDAAPFMLVKVIRTSAQVPPNYTSPLLDIDFNFPEGGTAIEVLRMRPATTTRGEVSTNLFELDESTGPFLVPCHLLRVGKLELQISQSAPVRVLRNGRGAPITRFELSKADKAKVYELCRIFDD